MDVTNSVFIVYLWLCVHRTALSVRVREWWFACSAGTDCRSRCCRSATHQKWGRRTPSSLRAWPETLPASPWRPADAWYTSHVARMPAPSLRQRIRRSSLASRTPRLDALLTPQLLRLRLQWHHLTLLLPTMKQTSYIYKYSWTHNNTSVYNSYQSIHGYTLGTIGFLYELYNL